MDEIRAVAVNKINQKVELLLELQEQQVQHLGELLQLLQDWITPQNGDDKTN